jgi:hypothetical protein
VPEFPAWFPWASWQSTLPSGASDALAQYRVRYEPDGHRFREVDEPRLFPTRCPSPQPFLPPLDEVEWHPAQRLAPYRPRRTNAGEGRQACLFDLAPATASG